MIDPEGLPDKARARFLRNQRIVCAVLGGASLKAVAKTHKLTPSAISQLMQRALGGDDAEDPPLTRALIPNTHVKPGERRQPLPSLGDDRGCKHAFEALLDQVPTLRTRLDEFIDARLGDKPTAQPIAPDSFFSEFKEVLAEVHWPRDRYPYTTHSCAREAVRRYLHRRVAELTIARSRKPEPLDVARARAAQRRAMRAIQIDEHVMDCTGRIHLSLNDEMIPLRIARASLLVASCVDTDCRLGFTLAPTRDPGTQEMLELFDNVLTPWEPLTLHTPGLAYTPGAGFPSGLDIQHPMVFGEVHMDNAWAHRSNAVGSLVCDRMGATLRQSHPRNPTARNLIEHVFALVVQQLTHRYASTTGSHPRDPRRESRKNRKRVPPVTFAMLYEALSVLLAEHNITPQAALGGATPLELFRRHCRKHYVPFAPALIRQSWRPFIVRERRRLHWHRHEKRYPHINFANTRYQGPCLVDAALKHKEILIEYDTRDIRTLTALTCDGLPLGEIQAPVSWQRFPHSLATRTRICKDVRRRRDHAKDPLAGHFRALLEERDTPDGALALLRVYTEFTQDGAESVSLVDTDRPSSPSHGGFGWQSAHAYRGASINRGAV